MIMYPIIGGTQVHSNTSYISRLASYIAHSNFICLPINWHKSHDTLVAGTTNIFGYLSNVLYNRHICNQHDVQNSVNLYKNEEMQLSLLQATFRAHVKYLNSMLLLTHNRITNFTNNQFPPSRLFVCGSSVRIPGRLIDTRFFHSGISAATSHQRYSRHTRHMNNALKNNKTYIVEKTPESQQPYTIIRCHLSNVIDYKRDNRIQRNNKLIKFKCFKNVFNRHSDVISSCNTYNTISSLYQLRGIRTTKNEEHNDNDILSQLNGPIQSNTVNASEPHINNHSSTSSAIVTLRRNDQLIAFPSKKDGIPATDTLLSCKNKRLKSENVTPISSDQPNFILKQSDGQMRSETRQKDAPDSTRAASQSAHPNGTVKSLKPREIVNFLDEHIVGQTEAKKAVANALRNRWRRQQVCNLELKDDILPKNILMVGPTGVGKSEIARRMAKIIDAPFLRVEATKYTEVGFHGKDVDTIIKDLVELAVRRQYVRLETELLPQAQRIADEKILQALTGQLSIEADPEMYENLRLGRFDNQTVTLDVPYPSGGGGGVPFYDLFNGEPNSYGNHDPSSTASSFSTSSHSGNNHTSPWRSSILSSTRGRERTEKRTMAIKECRNVLSQAEFNRMMLSVGKGRIAQQALESVEQEGIIFLDEIDKICSSKSHSYTGPDASAEGVQRDLLPLIEGTTISTRYGNVKTDYILFIASGAFHSVKPSDLMGELQGRLPVRVELQPLTEEDFRKILFDTRHNLLEQNTALLATEGVTLLFERAAVYEIAKSAFEVNSFVDNIGARRLVTIIEKIMEEISFIAPEMENGTLIRVTEDSVRRVVEPLVKKRDLHKFIL